MPVAATTSKVPTTGTVQLKLVIENATPEDAGNYAEALSNFSTQVQTFGSSYAKKLEADQKRYENQALKVFQEFGDPTQPVKDLSSYINKIDLIKGNPKAINSEKNNLKKQIHTFKKEIDQYENNISFFNLGKSTKVLLEQTQKKIKTTKSDIKNLEKKLQMLNN